MVSYAHVVAAKAQSDKAKVPAKAKVEAAAARSTEPLADAAPKPVKKRATHKRQPAAVMERILEAATAAFTRDGFKGAKMRSIAADAGITIQLLVYHAKTKDQLWQMVMENITRHYDEFQNKLTTLPPHTSATERLRKFISDIVHFTSSEPELHRIMTQEGSQLSPRLAWLSENFIRAPYEQFITLVEEAQREGSIPLHLQADRLRFAVVAMASVPFSVAAEYEYFTGRSPFSRGEVNKTIEMILHMVFPDPSA
jgi:TetR/AcrR family transcriptional regulator